MKRLGSIVLVLCLILGMVPLWGYAAEVASGTCGDNVTWSLDDNGTLTISGIGPMTDFNPHNVLWYNSSDTIKTAVIENGVTSIGSHAFYDCSGLTSVTIPDSVTSIGERAFSDCSGLTSVTIPDSVTSIGDWAFWDCSSLTSVTIPDSVTSMDDNPFSYCSKLTNINVASGNSAFVSENGVLFSSSKTTILAYPAGKPETAYVIPDSVTSIGGNAFFYCSGLTSVTIPDSVTSIGDWAFSGCNSLTSVTIPDSIASIGDRAFWDCRGLTSVTIPDSVTSIKDGTFNGCIDLTIVTIPDSVTSIGTYAFFDCSALKDVYYSGTEAQWGAITIDTENDPLLNATIHYNSAPASSVTVTFDGNGGTLTLATPVTVTVQSGATVAKPAANPTRDGYVFAGWFTDKDGRNAYVFTTPVTASITLYAGWQALSTGQLLVGSVTATQGDSGTVSIPVSIQNNPGLTGLRIRVTYPQVLTIQEVAFSNMFDTQESNAVDGANPVTLFFGGADTVSANGTLATLNFTLNANAEPGTYGFVLTVIEANREGQTPTFTIQNGQLTVNPGVTPVVITFQANGGSQTMDSVSVSPGATYTLPQNGFTPPDGMRFRAWQCVQYDANGVETITEHQPNDALNLGNSVSMTVTAQWAPVSEGDIIAQGPCGENLTYVLRSNGTLTISGAGAMTEYSASAPAPWRANRQDVKTVVIESGVSSIGAYAFNECGALANMTLPASMTAVTPHAFDQCGALAEVSYGGTFEQWDNVIFNTSDNNALEFATVRCGTEKEEYNAFRALNSIGKIDAASDQEWRLAAPLSKFRDLYIDVPDVEKTPNDKLDRKASPAQLTRAEKSKEYAATSGSAVLTIPKETFETFEEGSHNITATFATTPNPGQPGDTGLRKTSDVYTIFPSGSIGIDQGEMLANAVQDVSYTGRLQTKPKLSDRFYQFEITGAKWNGTPLAVTQENGGEQTENETADKVQRLGGQGFFFHPNGRFSGVPTLSGNYEFTVRLQVRREVTGPDSAWYEPTEPVTVQLRVEQKTASNIWTTSEGYELIQEPKAELEQGETFQLISKGAFEEFVDFYIDGVKQRRGIDYEVRPCRIDLDTDRLIELLDGGIGTGLFLQSLRTDLSPGLHSAGLEFESKDIVGNTRTETVARPINVRAKTVVILGGGGGGSRITEPSKTYAIAISKVSNGKVTASALKAAAGTSVTITVTPDSGYRTVSVSVKGKTAIKTTRNGNKYTFRMPSRAVTVSASFAPTTYSVTVSQSQHGKVTLNRTSAAKGTAINGSTTPDKGYQFQSVTVRDANGKGVKAESFQDGRFTFLMPEGKVTVSATFSVKRLASFVDIQGPDWFFDDAEWTYNRGILLGTTEQYWEPQSPMNSITSIVTLERLDGVDLTPYDTGADDGLDNSAWYVAALRWANANHITLSDRPFGGREALKRGEFAVMLSNYLRYRGLNPEAPAGTAFTDADTMTEEELNAFRKLQEADVFRGYSDGSIRPNAYLSRAHLAALLHRLSGYIIKAETG